MNTERHTNPVKKGKGLIGINFTVKEALNFVPKKPKTHRIFQRLEIKMKNGDSWSFGDYNAEECMTAIEEGTSQFDKPADLKQAKAQARRNSVKRRKKYTEFDGEPSAERFLGGSQTPFVRKSKSKSSVRTNIDIYINASASFDVGSHTLKEYYYEAIKEAYKYVLQGRMVNVYAVNIVDWAYKTNESAVMRTQLKESGKPVDFKRMALAAYPAFFRQIMLRAYLLAEEEHKIEANGSLGKPVHETKTAMKYINTAFKTESKGKQVLFFDLQQWQANGKKFKTAEEQTKTI